MRLYKITEEDIMETVENPDHITAEGTRFIALRSFANRFSRYPLKVVYEASEAENTIITAYPLKKRQGGKK